MNNLISKEVFLPVLEQTLNSGKDFVFTPTGTSMKPMLNGTTDKVTLAKKPETLFKYDVVFFKRAKDGALILHRIVKAENGSFVLSGDNQYYYDFDVKYDDIFAVVKSFTHNSKNICVDDFSYKLYSRIILLKKKARIFISKIYHKIFK